LRRNAAELIFATTLLSVLAVFIGPKMAPAQQKPKVSSQKSDKGLPSVFASVLPQIKAKSHVPVLLPSDLPSPISTAKYAVPDESETDKYAVTLFYERQSETAYFGFAAFFTAQRKPKFHPQELPDVELVILARHLHGFFRAVSCSGSCAPANLWWEQDGILYQVQLMLNANLSDEDQEKTIVAVVDSAILAGAR
jgi:hypothetical protein